MSDDRYELSDDHDRYEVAPVEPAGISPDKSEVEASMGQKTRGRPEPKLKLPQSVGEVLQEHVVLESESIDRMYLNVYVPQLQRIGGVV